MKMKRLSLLLLPFVTALSLQAQSPTNDPFDDPFFQDPFGDDIFKEMMQMQAQMDKMFERMHQRMQQRTQRAIGPVAQFQVSGQSGFADKGDHYELLTTIPESKENHINIQTNQGMLSITAKVVEEKEQKGANGLFKSSSVRVYQQAVSLPRDADNASITTAYQNGRLVVKINKKSTTKATKKPTPQPKPTQEHNSTTKPLPINSDKHTIS